MTKIKVKFVRGVDLSLEYVFACDLDAVVTIGRDHGCNIVVSEQEDTVSRVHAQLEIRDSKVFVRDCSTNGVVLNDRPVQGEHLVGHDDQLQLGPNGPVLHIVFDPPQQKKTRLMSSARGPATRIVEANTTQVAMPANGSPGIGAQTFERRLDEVATTVKKDSRRKLVNLSVFGLSVAVLLAGVFFYRGQSQDQAILTQASAIEGIKSAAPVLDPGLASSIKQKWANSTVRIDATWVLIDKKTDQTVFHVQHTQGARKLPLYIQMSDGSYRPSLTTNLVKGFPVVGGQRPGTGFIISEGGFIASAANVVAGWRAPFRFSFPGWVKTQSGSYVLMEEAPSSLLEWVPERDGYYLQDKSDKEQSSRFTGKNLQLYVTFPNSSLKIPASPGVVSNRHDVGLIKIDVAQKVSAVDLNRSGRSSRKAGDAMVLLGYPGLSIKTYLDEKSQSSGGKEAVATVPITDVSVNQGIISKVVPKSGANDEYALVTKLGDYLEMSMSINSSEGVAGGPIFDSQGRVTALYYNDISLTRRGTAGSIALGIPVEYVIELMDPTKALIN